MQAGETKVQAIIDSARQYVIPLFQRPYSWKRKQWETLWQDLVELCEEEHPRNHFIGSIVTMPTRSVPEGVTKYILIDGQQRLTTLLILLAAIRDKDRNQPGNLSQKIDDLLLKNRHQEGTDVYKLLPTQLDRPAFCAIVDNAPPVEASPIHAAYEFFERKLKLALEVSPEKLHTVIRNHLVLVSIVLDKEDNPHLIFESLNAKGQPLTQADLIRNFFFMRLHVNVQEKMYASYWEPMQQRLGDNLAEYIRHFLMRDGKIVRQSDVYFTLKERIEDRNHDEIVSYLQEVAVFSSYYARLLNPKANETRAQIAERIERLNRFDATTVYPFLLNTYHAVEQGAVSEFDFAVILEMLESFLIRRFICGVATSGLTKIFPMLYAQARENPSLVEGVRQVLRDKSFPRDKQFKEFFATTKIYGGDRTPKAKLILDRLEASFDHKEPVDLGNLTIEHVMPRTPTDWWRQQLGEDWEAVHDAWLDTIGNLTLTGYNSPMSNSDFPLKKTYLQNSHVELNRHFVHVETWDEQAIARRGEELAEQAVRVWPDFANRDGEGENEGEILSDVPDQELQEDMKLLIAKVLDCFGGQIERFGKGVRQFYRVGDGKVLNVKYSKRHNDYFWFGLHASLWEEMGTRGVTHMVFILMPDSFVTLPVSVMKDYIANAGYSPKSDGTVRHYHVLISLDANPELFHHGKADRIPLLPFLRHLDS